MNHGSFVNDQIVNCLVLMIELYFIFKCMFNPVLNIQNLFSPYFFSHVKLPSVFYQFIVGN